MDVAFYVDTLYTWAALNTEGIGEHIAVGLTHLQQLIPLDRIHLVGEKGSAFNKEIDTKYNRNWVNGF